MDDDSTDNFLQWFVAEQVEEEDSTYKIVQQLKLIGDDRAGLFLIDRELAKRVSSAGPRTGGTVEHWRSKHVQHRSTRRKRGRQPELPGRLLFQAQFRQRSIPSITWSAVHRDQPIAFGTPILSQIDGRFLT